MKILPISNQQNHAINQRKYNSVSFNARISMLNINKGLGALGTIGLATIGLQNTFQNIPINSILNKDSDGNTIINKASNYQLLLSDGQFKTINEQLKNSPDVLKEIYITPNNEGAIPAHRDLGLNKRRIMHEALKNYPEILAQIYLTEDKHHSIPTDTITYNEDISEFIEILSVLKDQPEVIDKILDYYPRGDINNRYSEHGGWYDIRTGNALSKQQKEMLKKRDGRHNIISKKLSLSEVSTIVDLLKDNPKTLSKLLANVIFFVDINNHKSVLNLLKDNAPEALADIYLYGRVSWDKPGEYQEYWPPYYASEPMVEGIPLSQEQENVMKKDILELALNSDLNASKSKKLLEKYYKDIEGYDSIMQQLNALELQEIFNK